MKLPEVVTSTNGIDRTVLEEMWTRATAAARCAYAPYSRFQVGAAVLGADDVIYVGCNVECADYDGTHAEESALCSLVLGGQNRFKIGLALAIEVGTGEPFPVRPCGKCRQKLMEMSLEDGQRSYFLMPTKPGGIIYYVSEPMIKILPEPFNL